MSAVPNRTQILIKDLPFQEKYNLSHSQTDLMAYLVNVTHWAMNIEGYFVIATSKIMSDLPAMGQKTIEASLKVLKDLELIECKIVEVSEWRGKPKLRGVKLTQKGKGYNAKLVLPSQDKRVKELEKKIKNLEDTIKSLTVSESEASAPKEEARLKPSVPSMPTLEAIEIFVDDVTKRFSKTSQPICNAVPKWEKETTFYINSYNKLSIITAQKEHKQLKNPLEINHFWQWLFTHNHRIGDTVDFNQTPTIKALEQRFLNQTIMIGKKEESVYEIVPCKDGVKIKVKNKNGKVGFIVDSNTQKEMVFTLKKCQEVLFGVLKCV